MSAPPEGVVYKLEALFQRYYFIAVEWASKRYGSRVLAEDAVQEAFTQLFVKAVADGEEVLNGGRAVVIKGTHWAACRMIERSEASTIREQRSAAAGVGEDGEWVRAQARTLVSTLCRQLSDVHREALYLHYVAGYTDETSARRVGISTKAFQSRCRRAVVAARELASRDL